MNPLAVLYATREGQTQKVAEYVSAGLRAQGFEVAVQNVRDAGDLNCDAYRGIILAASVHAGKHEREMMRFIRKHRPELNRTRNAFLSLTLSQAGVERTNATTEEVNRFRTDVQSVIDRFLRDSGWTPQLIVPVAGALLYSKYGFLTRFIMRRIARASGVETDTSHDYEYTNWSRLDQFVKQFAADIRSNDARTNAA
jgi:menaquinone-dependent protoporphyrinogen oxidase